jgi:hypothetical protein
MALILTLMTACAGEEESTVDLTLACQLSKCVCSHRDRPFFEEKEPEPVLWRENGDAYCPDGLELKLSEE